MKTKNLLLTLLLLVVGAVASLSAQTTVTQGDQVTSAANLQENVPYIIYQPRNATYIKEASDRYSAIGSNAPDDTGLFYFEYVSDGVYKIKSYSTGKYISKPTAAGIAAIAPVDEDAAGEWDLQFDSNGCIYPLCNGFGWDRGSNALWATAGASTTYNESGNVKLYKIYEVSTDEITLTFDKPGSATDNITVNVKDGSENAIPGVTAELVATSCTEFKTGSAEALTRTTNSILAPHAGYANTQNAQITYTFKVTGLASGFAYKYADLDVYALNAGGGSQETTANRVWSFDISMGQTAESLSTFVSSTGNDITYGAAADGGLTHKVWTMDAASEQNATAPLYIKVTLTRTDALGCYAGIRSIRLYSSTWAPTTDEVYTINNTNSGRGALIYNPDASTKWVWSSGKSGTFDATAANSQWVICPTATAGQYYFYNVGAKKFAVPTTGGTFNGVCWKFSNDAAPVELSKQDDGTYKIYAPYGTRYMAVSNGFEGPIINYNDIGGNFTITKVDDASSDVTTAVTAALDCLVGNRTKLTAVSDFTEEGGWFVIKVNSGDWVGHSFFTSEDEQTYNGTNYPLGFYGYGYEDASIANGQRLFRITKTSDGYTWQMPNGKYLTTASSKFPVSTSSAATVSIDKQDAGFRLYASGYYAKPHNLSNIHFVGETTSSTAIYDIYAADLMEAGLTAWQILCDNAPETEKITCSRSDVSGLTSAYKNGYIFLPTGVTPESSDFSLEGASGVTVDADAKTVTLEYDPTLAIVEGGVSVYQGFGTTGLGNEKAVLLRIVASPFQDMAAATLTATLTGAESISAVTLYETTNTVEWNAVSSYANTFAGTIDGSTVTFDLGANATAGTHYYWLCASVKSTATVGTTIDAALTALTYNREGQTSVTLDLTAVGNPDTAMKIFDVQSVPFVPTTYGSNYYRIPALIVAADGSVIAACDKRYNSSADLGNHKIDVVLRRSTDGGKTWSDVQTIAAGDGSTNAAYGYGDPALVKTNSGKLICLMAAGANQFQGGNLKNIGMVTSDDNGQTWSSVTDITTNTGHFTDNAGLTSSFFVTSGKGLCTNDGVVMFLLDAYNSEKKETNFVLYSTDEGENWIIDATVVCNGANEAKLQQLKDGSLIASIRTNGNRAFNRGSYVNNGDGTCTFTWGAANDDVTFSSTLNSGGGGNNQDILYYSTAETPDILFHTMTTNNHANLNLYMSLDQGSTWNLVQTVQPGVTRYAVLTTLSNGDLGILFEDYSLGAGCIYPITYVTITKEQIDGWYNAFLNPAVKNSVLGSATGANSYGAFSNASNNWYTTWTSNASSGKAGLTITAENAVLNHSSVYDQRCFALRPSANGATDVITITAPEGYFIDSYTITGRNYSGSQTYKLNDVTTSTSGATLTVENVNATSTSFNFYGSSTTNYLCVTNFVIQLKSLYDITLNTVGDKSYATLYLPFGVTLPDGVTAYALSVNGELAVPTEVGQEVEAETPVLLVADGATTLARAAYDANASSTVAENLLAGNLVAQHVDGYVLNQKDGVAGFYLLGEGKTLAANRAYLPASVKTAGIKGFAINWTEDGIEAPEAVATPTDTPIYNLAGQRVSTPRKGIYIVGGKKVLK